MRPLHLASILGMTLVIAINAPAAGAAPPPPPPTPVCGWCNGPPPAPTPVPTLAPTVIAPQEHSISVAVSPSRVKRGHRTSLTVKAASHDRVTMTLRYHGARATTYRATIGRSGKLTRRVSVSRRAPLGKAWVKIGVAGSGKTYRTSVSFTVLK